MINTFVDKPLFIESDPRIRRPENWQYTVTPDLMSLRHELFFQKTDLAGKTVLDLGCCCAATGAWVLDRGASHYTGVDLQKNFVKTSIDNLSAYYDNSQWSVVESSVESFLKDCNETYDVVLIAGMLHCIFDYHLAITQLTKISKEVIVECFHPYNAMKELYPTLDNEQRYQLCQTLSLVQIASETGTVGEQGGSWVFDGVRISMSALKNVFGYLGWNTELDLNDTARLQLPSVYDLTTTSYCPRYIARATPSDQTVFDFVDGYTDSSKTNYEYKSW